MRFSWRKFQTDMRPELRNMVCLLVCLLLSGVSRSVALTGQAIYRELVTSTVPAWRSNSLLRHLRVIYLDEDSCYEGESFTITLDCDLGVVVEYSQQGGDDA